MGTEKYARGTVEHLRDTLYNELVIHPFYALNYCADCDYHFPGVVQLKFVVDVSKGFCWFVKRNTGSFNVKNWRIDQLQDYEKMKNQLNSDETRFFCGTQSQWNKIGFWRTLIKQ